MAQRTHFCLLLWPAGAEKEHPARRMTEVMIFGDQKAIETAERMIMEVSA